MDDEVLVRVGHRRADLAKEQQPLVDAQTAFVAEIVQPLALDVLHDEVRAAIRRDRRAVEPGDVRVGQRGEHPPFVAKAAAAACRSIEAALEQFDGDAAAQRLYQSAR